MIGLQKYWCSVLLTGLVVSTSAQQFVISEITFDGTARAVIKHPSDPAYYYILYRGNDVTDIVSAVDMALGVVVELQLADAVPQQSAAFYRVRKVPVASPLDTDGDGIDDVWELRFRRPRAALNPDDANEDHTGSGTSDLLDYKLPEAFFAQLGSTVLTVRSNLVQLEMQFSRLFTGEAIVLLGGTAIHGQDFTIHGGDLRSSVFNSTNQTARVRANGNVATFNLTLLDEPAIDPDRYLLLSILEPPTNAPARYQTSQTKPANHTLRITEGDLGIYAGILEFTNRAGMATHPVRLAVRSAVGGTAEGYLDATQSPVFRRSFSLPVATSPDGLPLSFPQPLVHLTSAAALQRSLTYLLSLGAVTNIQDTFEAPATLRLTGLSQSGKAVTNQGHLRLVRVTSPE